MFGKKKKEEKEAVQLQQLLADIKQAVGVGNGFLKEIYLLLEKPYSSKDPQEPAQQCCGKCQTQPEEELSPSQKKAKQSAAEKAFEKKLKEIKAEALQKSIDYLGAGIKKYSNSAGESHYVVLEGKKPVLKTFKTAQATLEFLKDVQKGKIELL